MTQSAPSKFVARSVVAAVLSASAFAALPQVARAAGTDTDNLPVTATVESNCTIDASAGLDFGVYDPIVTNTSGSPLDAQGSVHVVCTNGSAVTITLGQGDNHIAGSAAAPQRRMADVAGTSFLSYFLYSDASQTVWGDTSLTGKADTGNGADQSLTVFGSVPGGQNIPVGSYSDTVLATVTF
jgi:spore coat protein U-like protein